MGTEKNLEKTFECFKQHELAKSFINPPCWRRFLDRKTLMRTLSALLWNIWAKTTQRRQHLRDAAVKLNELGVSYIFL
jgi:hypothetical protein